MNFPSPPDCPYYLIYRVSLSITAALKKGLSDAGADPVKPAYLGVLISLWNEDQLRAIDLGRQSGLEPSSMTGLLDRMERDGLVRREPDPEDRRAIRICLTDAGRAAEKPALRAVTEILDGLFDGIAETDIETTRSVLRTILTNCTREGIR